MSSSSAAFARALSPSLDALTQAVHNQTVNIRRKEEDWKFISEDKILILQARISECRTIEQVIDTVPLNYRPSFRDHLLSFASWCEKKEGVKTSYERLKRTLEGQVVPPRLKVKAPEFQFTKEFGDSGSAASKVAKDAFSTATATFQEAVNVASLAGKKAELEFWEDKCDTHILLEKLSDIVASVWNDNKDRFKVPTVNYDDQGNAQLGEWEISSQRFIERDTLLRAIPLIGAQIDHLVDIRHRAMAIKINKKTEIAKKADVEMADATKPGPSIQSLIDKGLNARLKKLNLVPGKKVNNRSYPHLASLTTDCSNYSELVWPREKGTELEVRCDFFKGSSREEEIIYGVQGETQGKTTDGQEEGGQEAAESRKERSERKGKGKSIVTEKSVSIYLPQSLPDEILNYTWDHAVTYVHLHTSLDFLEAGLYRNSVHCSDGVSVPKEISNDLSLGLKYMFFSPPSSKLIMEAWSEFQIRLRWRIFFLFKEGLNRPYDPDYSVGRKFSKEKKTPPKLPQWMEIGLVMGRRYVFSTIASIPDEKLMAIKKNPFSPNSYNILQFLKDNDYVITMTDKNLGLAVSKRDWIISNELKLLHDKRNYKCLDKVEADEVMNEKGRQMISLAELAEEHLFLSELKVPEYFKSLVHESGEDPIYPQFHGLPKIHKKPTGFRPIIPCHSVCFNPAAKFVSKELKPLIKAAPSVIHGTKDLFIRLSQLRIDPRRKLFFVTGDVVAFYPNVPLDTCIDVVTTMYEQWLFDNSVDDAIPLLNKDSLDNNLIKLKVFKRAIEIGNTRLITLHEEKYYEQLNGLAMGVSDAPDLANLFGVHYEKQSGILHHPQVVFYGRYIDDCIGLVYAESADEALALLADTIKFDGCVIEWAVSDSSCQFLDSTIYKGPNKELRWKPFVKVGNNRERIPWVSHHPMDVKRGVYIGELSRISVLCSHKETYIEAVRDLNALYQARGYPVPLIAAWCKKNIQERWEKRFSSRNANDQGDESVLVLKTRFDDVWNWFSATELGNTVTKYWEEWYERATEGRYSNDPSRPFPTHDQGYEHDLRDVRPELFRMLKVDGEDVFVPDLGKIGLLGSRWIVSRKRTTNLFDLANVWKKTVFRKLDDKIATEGGVNPTIPSTDHLDRQLEAIPRETTLNEDIILHQREHSQELEHPEFGRISKVYT